MNENKFFIKIIILLLFLNIFIRKTEAYQEPYQTEIKNISEKVTQAILKSKKKLVAVVDFSDLQGNINELGRFIAEEISVALIDDDQEFKLVERIQMHRLLLEHKLYMSDLTEPSNAQKFGRIAGVDALVSGTITAFGDSIRVSVKIIDIETAHIIGATAGNIPKTKTIEELLPLNINSETQSSTLDQSTKPSKKISQSKTACGFKIELQTIEKTGNGLVIRLVITSLEHDRELSINGYCNQATKIYDDVGNEYIAQNVKIVDKTNSCSTEKYLIQDVPVKVSLSFDGVVSEAKKITLLKIGLRSTIDNGSNYCAPEFRNIDL